MTGAGTVTTPTPTPAAAAAMVTTTTTTTVQTGTKTRQEAADLWSPVIAEVMDCRQYPNMLRTNALVVRQINVRMARVARILTATPVIEKDKSHVFTNPDHSTALPPGQIHAKGPTPQTYMPSDLPEGTQSKITQIFLPGAGDQHRGQGRGRGGGAPFQQYGQGRGRGQPFQPYQQLPQGVQVQPYQQPFGDAGQNGYNNRSRHKRKQDPNQSTGWW
jgi:hypothetical protein